MCSSYYSQNHLHMLSLGLLQNPQPALLIQHSQLSLRGELEPPVLQTFTWGEASQTAEQLASLSAGTQPLGVLFRRGNRSPAPAALWTRAATGSGASWLAPSKHHAIWVRFFTAWALQMCDINTCHGCWLSLSLFSAFQLYLTSRSHQASDGLQFGNE